MLSAGRILGQGLSLRDSDLRPLGQCLDPKLLKGNSWRYLGISGPTYCLTSCSPVVRALVYHPSGQGSIRFCVLHAYEEECAKCVNLFGYYGNNQDYYQNRQRFRVDISEVDFA